MVTKDEQANSYTGWVVASKDLQDYQGDNSLT